MFVSKHDSNFFVVILTLESALKNTNLQKSYLFVSEYV